ncbi:hypothetical protein THMIRHAS_21010 [Thiosulfatimonas sediminis]|uniref:Prepilin-type N-terminal cleavage/methylation domain-containing protein n=1 Tax=Thiosulfatimonas sediminis TaxID=2675054 RepID=A0A6F8PXL0_9GAMM|nr:prepilin-type N-terminal cleavage/methylation domain-containing protein [Thiosulfatimonas sediminis]BBP46728.1 hypothetical protein THMIRHAS_21010 [Thiosulfatimonas sediminis]
MPLSISKRVLIRGFSLLELALAIVILGILLLIFNGVFKLFFETDHRIQQIYENKLIQDAMETYVAVNFRLPCPDTDGDGYENPSKTTPLSAVSDVCSADSGGLPYNELGTKSSDAWGNGYFYKVIASASDTTKTVNVCESASFFGRSGVLEDAGLQICTSTNEVACDDLGLCPNGGTWIGATLNGNYSPYGNLYTPTTDALEVKLDDVTGTIEDTGVLAVVISWGANGDQANNANCPSDLNSNEKENCDGDDEFIKTQKGLDRDYLVPITLFQAKKAMVASRRFK